VLTQIGVAAPLGDKFERQGQSSGDCAERTADGHPTRARVRRLGALFGWRSVFWTAAIFMLILAVGLHSRLPRNPTEQSLSWLSLMCSIFGLVRKARRAAGIGPSACSA
jgi:hypothetical protein